MASARTGSGLIPVINLSADIGEKEIARQLVDAATAFGFVYIKNEGHDIPVEAIDDLFNLNRGWSGMHTETLDSKNQRVGDFKEAMNFGEFINGKAQQPLPSSLGPHESELAQFQSYCHDMMLKILTLFAIGLEVDESKGGSEWFSSRHRDGPSGCTLRLLHYPSIPAGSNFVPSVDIRAGAHSDYGSITLLFQRPGQPGLEIIPPSTRTHTAHQDFGPSAAWTPVPVYPPGTENDPSPPILVNIGDLLSHWTNNLFKSTVHRVVFPKEGREGGDDRYSIAYFGHPVDTTVLEPVPSARVIAAAVDGSNETGVKAMTANEHLMSRLKATYLDMYKDNEASIGK